MSELSHFPNVFVLGISGRLQFLSGDFVSLRDTEGAVQAAFSELM